MWRCSNFELLWLWNLLSCKPNLIPIRKLWHVTLDIFRHGLYYSIGTARVHGHFPSCKPNLIPIRKLWHVTLDIFRHGLYYSIGTARVHGHWRSCCSKVKKMADRWRRMLSGWWGDSLGHWFIWLQPNSVFLILQEQYIFSLYIDDLYLVNEVDCSRAEIRRQSHLTTRNFPKSIQLIIPPWPKWELIL